MNLDNGKIIWDKDHNVSFISNIKIDDDRFYIVDANNVIYCFSLLDGSKIWEFATDYELVKSQKKLSIVFDNEKYISITLLEMSILLIKIMEI